MFGKGRKWSDYLCLILWLFVAMLRLLLLLLGERGLVEIWLQKPCFVWCYLRLVEKAVGVAKDGARDNLEDVCQRIVLYL